MFFSARSHKSERGQMVVIVALALTTLIAMAGLVIDGGMALSNRRQVQNAADSAALAGTRVLGLDLKWRAVNAGNPSAPAAPFPNVDAAVCDAINNALAYNTNSAQTIAPIDCYAGSDDAWYVEFGAFDADPEDDMRDVGRVGDGVPALAQGVRVRGSGQSATFLMGVIGIDSIDVGEEEQVQRRARTTGEGRSEVAGCSARRKPHLVVGIEGEAQTGEDRIVERQKERNRSDRFAGRQTGNDDIGEHGVADDDVL